MFTSFSNSFAQLSPKKLLASYLSRQLAEFFDVDANTIETNLVTDAHIKLQNVRIQPYLLEASANPNVVTVTEGWVESIEFSWEWGTGFGQGAKAYIQHVQLRVQGVKLQIRQEDKQNAPGKIPSISKQSPDPVAAPVAAPGDPDWKARYLQQIVDHLTLVLESVEVSIELPSRDNLQSSVVVFGKQMELITLGGSSPQGSDGDDINNNGLRQRLSVGSLSAIIRQATAATSSSSGTGTHHQELPLLDPVGYRAMVQRVSGRRFLDGIGAGLVIAGERILSGAGSDAQQHGTHRGNCALQLHAGIQQVSCLLQLQRMFGFDGESRDSSLGCDTTTNATTGENPTAATCVESESSLFVLPLEYMSLMLHNGTSLGVNNCVVTIRTDGSVFEVESPEGDLWVNGKPVNNIETGTWRVDLIRSHIRVQSNSSATPTTTPESTDAFFDSVEAEETLMKLEIQVDQCRDIYQGFNAIVPLFDENADENVTPWTFEVDGRADLTLSSSSGKKASASIFRPSMKYIGSKRQEDGRLPGLPCVYNWDAIAIESQDLGDVVLSIPKIDPSQDGLSMFFQDKVTLTVDSMEAMEEIWDFVCEFTEILEGESTGVPLSVALPLSLVVVRKEGMEVTLEGVLAAGFDVCIKNATGRTKQGHCSAQGLKYETQSITAYITKISSMQFGEDIRLVKPLDGATVQLKQDRLIMQLGHPELALKQSSAQSQGSTTSVWGLTIPIAFDISVQGLTLFEDDLTQPLLILASGGAKADPTVAQTNLDFDWKSLKYKSFEMEGGAATIALSQTSFDASLKAASFRSTDSFCRLAVEGVQVHAVIEASAPSDRPYWIESVGFLRQAHVSTNRISCASHSHLLALRNPVDEFVLEYADGLCSVKLGELDIDMKYPAEKSEASHVSAGPSNSFQLPFPVVLSSPSFTVCQESGGFEMMNTREIRIEVCPSGLSTQAKLSCSACVIDQKLSGESITANLLVSDQKVQGTATCSRLLATKYSGVDIVMKTLQCSVLVHTKSIMSPHLGIPLDGFGTLIEASASIPEIESLSIDGSGNLSVPLPDVGILFQNGVVEICAGNVSWCLLETTASNQELSLGSSISGFELPFPVQISIPSALVFKPQQIGPILEWKNLSLFCETKNHLTNAHLKCDTGRIYHVGVGAATVSISTEASLIRLKAEFETLSSVDSFSKFSMVSPSISFTLETSPKGGLIGVPVESIGRLIEMDANVKEIDVLSVQGVGALLSPLENSSLSFAKGKASFKLDCVHWHDFDQTTGKEPSGVAEDVHFLSTAIEILIESVQVDRAPPSSNEMQPVLGLKKLHVETKPIDPAGFLLPFSLNNLEDVWYLQMIKVPKLQLQGFLNLKNTNVVERLNVNLSKLHLSADFSSTKWSEALTSSSSTGRSQPLALPHAHINGFDLVLSGKGQLLSLKDTVLHCSSFSGTETSNTDSVSNHYIRTVTKRIPYLISTTEVLGANVGDSIGMVGAQTILSSSVVGGVVGLGARDAVGSAISLGKTSRGATESQRYHFGDFSRGVLAATTLAAKKGSSKRGGTQYQVGDFATGASSASGEYVSRNRERLGGAVGTSTAMMVGAAALGPIGLVAGAVVGGMAGKEVVKATVGEYKGNKDAASGPQGSPPDCDSSLYQTQPSTNPRKRTEKPQPTNISQSPSQSDGDPFDVFMKSESPSASHADTTITRQAVAAKVVDPFSVFETPTPKPPPAAYEVPPDDPLAFLAGREPPKPPTSHLTQSAVRLNQGHPVPTPRHAMNQQEPASQQLKQAYPAQQGITPRDLPMGRPHQYPTETPQQAPMHAGRPHQVPHAARQQSKGYKFGDVTKGLIAKGKEKRGGGGGDYKVR